MNNPLFVALIGLVVGVAGTTTGGMLALGSKGLSRRMTGAALEFSAGMMLAVLALNLLPAAFSAGGIKTTIIGVVFGICFSVVLQDIIKYQGRRCVPGSMMGSGILLVIVVALHNLPEGLAIGASFMTSRGLCLSIALTLFLHNIPEGLAIAIPLRKGGCSAFKMLFIVALAGFPMAVGAFLGGLFGEAAAWMVPFCLAFAAGAMLYISVGDILAESREIYKGRFSYIANTAGFVFGILITQLLE